MQYKKEYIKDVLTKSFNKAIFFEEACQKLNGPPRMVSNWMEYLMSILNNSLELQASISSEDFASLLQFVIDDVISDNVGKDVLEEIIETGKNAQEIIERDNLKQISDAQKLNTTINEVIEENPNAVQDVENGEKKAIGFLVGQVMQKTQGKANPKIVNEILQSKWNGD